MLNGSKLSQDLFEAQVGGKQLLRCHVAERPVGLDQPAFGHFVGFEHTTSRSSCDRESFRLINVRGHHLLSLARRTGLGTDQNSLLAQAYRRMCGIRSKAVRTI